MNQEKYIGMDVHAATVSVAVKSFYKAAARHVYGVVLKTSLGDLGAGKNGKYEIIAQYHSPVPSSSGFGLPIWSMEDGTLSSKTVTITVGD